MTKDNNMTTTLLLRLKACHEAQEWAVDYPVLADAWTECPRGDWLLWVACSLGIPRPLLVLAACACARTVLHLVPAGEDRPRVAIETAESWARGGQSAPSLDDVRKAADAAADAAYAAATHAAAAYADAAYAAAYNTAADAATYATDAATYAAYAAAADAAARAAAAAYAAYARADAADAAADAAIYAAATYAAATYAAADATTYAAAIYAAATYATAAAAAAAAAAARSSSQAATAAIVRRLIPWDVIEAAVRSYSLSLHRARYIEIAGGGGGHPLATARYP